MAINIETPTTEIPTIPTPKLVTDIINPPSVNDVFSQQNTQQALTQPAQQPATVQPTTDPNSSLGIYSKYFDTPEMQQAKQRVAGLQQQQNQVTQGLRTTTNALNNQNQQAMGGTGASINLIGGQVARARNLASSELSAIGENMSAEQSALNSMMETARQKFNIEMEDRNKIEELIAKTGGKAGIEYGMDFKEAMRRTAEYEVKQEKEAYKRDLKRALEEEKRLEKKALKSQARELGLKTEGSRYKLSERIKEKMKSVRSVEDRMRDLELKMKENAYRKSLGAEDGENGDVNAMLIEYFKNNNGGAKTINQNTQVGGSASIWDPSNWT